MTLVKEDFYPRRPTRASVRDALPEFATALALLVAPFVGGAEWAFGTMQLEFAFLPLLFIAAVAGSNRGFGRWIGIGWAVAMLLAITGALAFFLREWTYLLAAAFVIGAHASIVARRERWLQRDLLAARAGFGFLLAWALVFVVMIGMAVAGTEDDRVFTAAWGATFFALLGLVDLHRILTPPPPDAGPGWWRWDAPG